MQMEMVLKMKMKQNLRLEICDADADSERNDANVDAQVTSLSKWDSLVGEEGLLKPSERPVVLNRSTFQLCPILSTIVYFCPLWSIYTHCFYFCLIVTIFVCTSQVRDQSMVFSKILQNRKAL